MFGNLSMAAEDLKEKDPNGFEVHKDTTYAKRPHWDKIICPCMVALYSTCASAMLCLGGSPGTSHRARTH